jgi:adenylosuccinate synthase
MDESCCGLSLLAFRGVIEKMNICVTGLQWGDEGKGKVVDILAEDADIVVRYGGGANAGHTVVIDDEKFALHLLPSGVVRPNVTCVIANGVVVDPQEIISEIDALEERGIDLDGRLLISESAHLVLDYHKREDQLREQSLGKDKLGTTIRGIGPCYSDKIGRSYAVRVGDLLDEQSLKEKIEVIVAYKNKFMSAIYGAQPMSVEEIFNNCREYAKRLSPFAADTTEFLHKSIADGKSILFEGAQGSLLDLDHGTFPYVTSSNASSLGMAAGCGVGARFVDEFMGVVKAYSTRVGAGPFPTELDNQIGQYIRDRGHEYGTTTGRPRRCGWFDAVAVSYSITIGSIDSVALMHLDTLTGLKELKICKAYEIDGKTVEFFPSNLGRLSRTECIYETVPGWDDEISGIKEFEKLPKNAQDYVILIEELTGIPVTMIGLGPQRSQTLFR